MRAMRSFPRIYANGFINIPIITRYHGNINCCTVGNIELENYNILFVGTSRNGHTCTTGFGCSAARVSDAIKMVMVYSGI